MGIRLKETLTILPKNKKMCTMFVHTIQVWAYVTSHGCLPPINMQALTPYQFVIPVHCSAFWAFPYTLSSAFCLPVFSSTQLTCHMESYSITCHTAEVTFPHLPQPIKTGRLTSFGDLGEM